MAAVAADVTLKLRARVKGAAAQTPAQLSPEAEDTFDRLFPSPQAA